MSIRVIFDESHGEQLSIFNHQGLTYVIKKLKIIPFRLISGPITLDKVASEDVLFLGGPIKKFSDFEIETIKYFVSKGKFLIITCPVPIPFNFTLNEVIKGFGMQFEYNIIQDKKYNLSGAMYFPIIRKFKKSLITQDVKELVYSGCSIKKLRPDIKILALSDENAEPPSKPVIATSKDNNIICIGSSSLFQDDQRYGIKAKNNIRLLVNLFRSIIRLKIKQKKESKVVKSKKSKSIALKRAKKYSEKLVNNAIIDLEKISNDIDRLFNNISKLIDSQEFSMAEETLNVQYSKFKRDIENIYQELMEKIDDLNDKIQKNIDFSTLVKEFTDKALVMESETISKLDMIRFNLSNRISNEKLRHSY